MAEHEQESDWAPVGIRWGTASGICYAMGRHHGLQDLSSLLAADAPIDSLPDDIAPRRIEPPTPTPLRSAGSPPPLPPPMPG